MKKLLMILAACATAMVASAAIKTQVDFESGLGGFTGTGGGTIEPYTSPTKPGQTYPFSGDNTNNNKYCAVDADSEYTLTGPAGSGATCFDMYVQFPEGATTPDMNSLGGNAKVAVYLDYDGTNVCVVSGNGSGGTTITKIETTVVAVTPGDWVRLTIVKVSGGYKVYIDGTAVRDSAFAAISGEAPSYVDFAGCGNLDNYVARTTDPFGGEPPTGWIANIGTDDPEKYFTDYTKALEKALAGATLTFADGVTEMDGTAEHPFEIRTADDLKALADAVNAGKSADKCFVQTANIDMTGAEAFAGIGVYAENPTAGTPFTGMYDGGNFKISNVTMTGRNYGGIFNQVNGGTIKNLTVENISTAATSGEFGYAIVGNAGNGATLENLTAAGTFLLSETPATHNAAGIVVRACGGGENGTLIKDCTNNATIYGDYTKLGGICALTQNKVSGGGSVTFDGCVNNGTLVSARTAEENASKQITGIAGIVGYTADATVLKDCENNGTITVALADQTVGELVGSGGVETHGSLTDAGGNKADATKKMVHTRGVVTGFQYATVDNGVATTVTTLANNGAYLLEGNVAASETPVFTFAEAGTIAFDAALGYTFEGTVTVAETPALVLNTVVVDDVTTYTAAQVIVVDEDTPSVNVTGEWIAANVEGEATPAKIKEALATPDSNGLTKWENYVLGQDPNTPVKVDVEQGSLTMPVASTLKVPTVDVGCTVKYSLDKVNASGTVVDPGTQQDATDFSIDLSQITETTFFRMAASISDGTKSKTVNAANTIGVLVLKDAPATTLIGVPFASLGDNGSISISNLVRTANLETGDTISAYDSSAHKFRTWAFDKTTGVWSPAGVGGAEPAEADTIKIDRGKGVWLTRQHPERPIYLVGELVTDDVPVSSTLEAGSGSGKTWNIVAPPSAEAFDLNAKLASKASADDQIIVPTKGAPKNFTLENGKWGYEKKVLGEDGLYHSVRTEDATVPAGRGFWYINSTNKTSIGL